MKCCLYICHKIRNNFRDMALCLTMLVSYKNLCEGKQYILGNNTVRNCEISESVILRESKRACEEICT